MQLKGIEVSFGDGHLKIEERDISTEELHKVLTFLGGNAFMALLAELIQGSPTKTDPAVQQ